MTQISLCREDPLVRLLHELFGANIVRVPDARVRPLSVVVHRGGRSFFRGGLLPLLADSRPLGLPVERARLSDVSGRRSRQVTLELGLHILRGFLRGLGLPSADLAGQLDGAATLAFSFPNVYRESLDINGLGWALAGRQVDTANPAAAFLLEQPRYDLLLIDSVLVSDQIKVLIGGQRGRGLGVDVAALPKLFGGVSASVEQRGEHELELTLPAPAELTFAFSCVRVFLGPDGRVSAIPPDFAQRTLGGPAASLTVRYSPDRVLLHDRPGLLMWDRGR